MDSVFAYPFQNKTPCNLVVLTIRQGVSNALAEWTGLEPATPGVTGRYSNQLNYHSKTAHNAAALGGTTQATLVGADGLEPPTSSL